MPVVQGRAEESYLDKVMRVFLSLAIGSEIPGPFAGLSAVLGRPQPTWYERHRNLYAATGDQTELDRMLRHVS